MRLGGGKSHLTYCLNVHPAETWSDTFDSIRTYPSRIKKEISPDKPFGLGLRISNAASLELCAPEVLQELKTYLAENGLYVFTINGFPYGPFHGEPVKQDVYRPDWTAPERLAYSMRLGDIIAELLPEGVRGSISTVPCSYKSWIDTEADRALMVKKLVECAEYYADIEERTGREIHLGLEPEPDCYIETTDELIDFFSHEDLADDKIRRHLGVCFDTCHLAVEYEDLCGALAKIVDAGIRVSKIQLSSALKMRAGEGCREILSEYNDDVYLHQVKSLGADGKVTGRPDLPQFFSDMPEGDCRVHCHVPLYFEGNEKIESTSSDLTPDFFDRVSDYGIEHLEIETYTFNVLPKALKSRGVAGSIIDEYKWVLERTVTGGK